MAYVKIEYDRGAGTEKVDLRPAIQADDGATFQIGQMIWGGEGGNGLVFSAVRPGSVGVKCAIKILRKLDAQRVDRFNNEVTVLRQLDHEHITAYHGHGSLLSQQGRRVPWVAIDLGGPNLGLHVKEYGPLSPALLGKVGRQMCGALKHLHGKEMIHRDLKPANFVWTESAQSERVFMIDFGLAKRVGENTAGRPFDAFTQVGEFVGPVFYSSRKLMEYARDQRTAVDHRSDMFQLGRVLWFLATGTPGAGIPAKKHDPTHGVLHDLVMKLLPDDPDERINSITEVDAVLQTLCG